MKCKSCGKEIGIEANFCKFCGVKQHDVCNCGFLNKQYNCGHEKCPGTKIYAEILRKSKAEE